tara:strand:- start:3814 stop:4770 length:957 start_codon:yes stop_codon:yes gene_type:complete
MSYFCAWHRTIHLMQRFHPIGTPGQPWTDADKATWFEGQQRQRSYRDEVLDKLERLGSSFEIAQYGALEIDTERFPLFAVTCKASNPDKPWALVTGGVHGYETSGVQGALAFLATKASSYTDRVNLLVAPCVSPWSYEVIHRWNPHAVDPNRSFVANSPATEAATLMELVAKQGVEWLMHIDLHETTDSDEDEFRPALAARDGKPLESGPIPDGFYTVGDESNPQPEFQAAIIAAVEKVTHIAPADDKGEIIGCKVTQNGVINYALAELGLCAGMTGARFTSTTEVYPDSPKVTADNCNAAQVAAVCAALDFAIAHSS